MSELRKVGENGNGEFKSVLKWIMNLFSSWTTTEWDMKRKMIFKLKYTYFYRSSVESRTFHLSRFHLQTNFIKFHINEDIRANAVENIFLVAIESLLKKCRSRNHQITFIFTISHIPRCFHSICIIRTFPLPRHFNFDISIQFTSNIRLSWGTEAVISAGSYRIIISIYSDRCQKNCECEEMKNFFFSTRS